MKQKYLYRMNAPAGIPVDGSGKNPCLLRNGNIVLPERNVEGVLTTDVLVVGGGVAGTAAAIAASRAGCKVVLLERYGYFGGLATGGLILTILGHWTEDGRQVCGGIGEEIMRRLEKMPYGIVRREPKTNPVVDGESLKYLLDEMILEAGVETRFHSTAAEAIMDDNIVRGAVFHTKRGPQAVLAKQTIDASGDGDLFASAGAIHEERIYAIGSAFRAGNMPEESDSVKCPGDPTPILGIRWINIYGRDGNALDVETLTQREFEHRKTIQKRVEQLREQPGFGNTVLLETAPRIGVRISRVLSGVETIAYDGFLNRRRFEDCVGHGGADRADHHEWQIPLGSLLPRNVENILAAGRCISFDTKMSDLVRLIPNCWVSGQAAGIAAACAKKENAIVRNVDYNHVRKQLLDQNAWLDA